MLFERVSRTRKRPLLQTADPRATMRKLLAVRDPLYAACAHRKIDTSLLGHAEVADAVLRETRDFVHVPPRAGRHEPTA